jgi:hypothetical protein
MLGVGSPLAACADSTSGGFALTGSGGRHDVGNGVKHGGG